VTDAYAWDNGPAGPPNNDPASSGIFGNDFSSSVAGQITAVLWWAPASSGHTSLTAQVHLQATQALITTEASGTLTAGAVNRITLSSPVTVTIGAKYTVSAHLATSARMDYQNPSTDRTASNVTAYGSLGRFKNIGFAVGDYPTSTDAGTGMAVGIEFTPAAADPGPVAVFPGFTPGSIAPTGRWQPWLGVEFATASVQVSALTGQASAAGTATSAAAKVAPVSGRVVTAATTGSTAAKVSATTGRAAAFSQARTTAAKVAVATGRVVAASQARAAAAKIVAVAGRTCAAAVATAIAVKTSPATGRTATAATAAAVAGVSGATRPAVGRVIGLATLRCRARFLIPRPSTGTISRPGAGTVARPDSGVVTRP
jgi:hypothetical protein